MFVCLFILLCSTLCILPKLPLPPFGVCIFICQAINTTYRTPRDCQERPGEVHQHSFLSTWIFVNGPSLQSCQYKNKRLRNLFLSLLYFSFLSSLLHYSEPSRGHQAVIRCCFTKSAQIFIGHIFNNIFVQKALNNNRT